MRNVFLTLLIIFFSSCNEVDDKKSLNGHPQYITDLLKKVEENPDSTGLRMKLINSLDSLQMYNEAIAQTDSLINKDSLNNGLWFTKARLQESNKDTAEAISSYERALNIYPSVEAQLNLANLFAETGNQNALLLCRNISAVSSGRETDAACNFIVGIFYARTGNKQSALQFLDKAINDNYTLMEAYMEKGFIYYDDKNFNEALRVFQTAESVNNTYADAYYWKAKCYEALGNKPEAIINYKRSLGLDKQLKEAAEAIRQLE